MYSIVLWSLNNKNRIELALRYTKADQRNRLESPEIVLQIYENGILDEVGV